MNLMQCPNGHFYNPALSDGCPVCGEGTGNSASNGSTMSLEPNGFDSMVDDLSSNIGVTVPVDTKWDVPAAGRETVRVNEDGSPEGSPDDGKTIMVNRTESGIDPVCGWLVCIDGKNKGKEYRICTGNSTVGRDKDMRISISGDESITRKKAAVITYDALNRRFYLGSGEGTNVIRHNDAPVLPNQSVQLNAYDKITLGASVFMFIPMCGEQFNWE